MRRYRHLRMRMFLIAVFVFLAGCSSTLVNDPRRRVSSEAVHCSGSEGVDDSSIAVLPIPLVAFFVPQADLNEVSAERYLSDCGDPSRLVNRKVEVSRATCVPTSLTRFITLGIWQWCPARVSWQADVEAAPPQPDKPSRLIIRTRDTE